MAKFSGAGADNELVQPCEDKDYKAKEGHWIEIEMVYENAGEPVGGEEYCITLPDSTEVRGLLNAKGWARVNLVQDPGNCKITFPNLDKEAWENA